MGLDRVPFHRRPFRDVARRRGELSFEQVTSLDCFCERLTDNARIVAALFYFLSTILPNLNDLDITNVETSHGRIPVEIFCTERCPALTKVTWKNCSGLYECGYEFRQIANLTHLYLDGSTFSRYGLVHGVARSNLFLFVRCRQLTHLSLKGARIITFNGNNTEQPLPQESIIDMVRHCPTLRWLRSDLSEENVATLKQE